MCPRRALWRGLKLRALTIALVMWLLVGCATTKWSHPTAGEQQFKADDSECEKLAAASVGYLGYPARAGAQSSQAVYQSTFSWLVIPSTFGSRR